MAGGTGKRPSKPKPSRATGRDRRLRENRQPGQPKPGPKPKQDDGKQDQGK